MFTHYYPKIIGHILENKRKCKCVCIHRINHNENEDENEKLMTEFYKYLYGYSASTMKGVLQKGIFKYNLSSCRVFLNRKTKKYGSDFWTTLPTRYENYR